MPKLTRLSLLTLAILMLAGMAPTHAQDSKSEVTLRWNPQVPRHDTYNLSFSGKHGDNIEVRTETFTVVAESITGGEIQFSATGEPVPPSAPLKLRFQRSLFSKFTWTVDELGNTTVPAGQPFPPFLSIPIFPEGAVSEGSTWSGGPVGVLPHPNVGPIPFTFTSTLTSVANYRGHKCAIIETDYKVALPSDAKSTAPFIGVVQGDEPSTPGQGAPIGGIVKDSPADKAGIKPKDFIIEAEGQKIRGWGGLAEIMPMMVPGKPVHLKVQRGADIFGYIITPEGIPLVKIAATGGLHSTCFFSLDSGIPMKTDVKSVDLKFILSNDKGETEEHPTDLHLVMEFQHGNGTE